MLPLLYGPSPSELSGETGKTGPRPSSTEGSERGRGRERTREVRFAGGAESFVACCVVCAIAGYSVAGGAVTGVVGAGADRCFMSGVKSPLELAARLWFVGVGEVYVIWKIERSLESEWE